MSTTDLSLKRTVFRVVAFTEAVSWLGLLLGMFFKYVTETGEAGVKIFGPIHGGIFLLYLAVTLWVARPFGWRGGVLVAALLSAIPPFATAIFEVWADRRGLIGSAAARDAADSTESAPAGVPD